MKKRPYNRQLKSFIILCGLLLFPVFLLISCKTDNPSSSVNSENPLLQIPQGFPNPEFPLDNPYSEAKAKLGRMLYYERILSKDSSVKSCSHCLKQAHAFSDCTPVSLGIAREPESRNTMSLQNAVYRKKLFWDGRGNSIEAVAYRSLWLPYIMASDTNQIVRRLEAHPLYPEMFRKAFGDSAKISATLISKAIATFVRTLISGNSPYDHYLNGDKNALTASQKRGMDLFFSDKAKCSVCHSGLFFSDTIFHNTGVVTHYFDRGRFEVTKKDADRGKFLTPTLRNVEMTAPYMHNGEISTLKAVIEHYNRGGRAIVLKDTLIKPLNLTDGQKEDLLNFLKALTDKNFINNCNQSNPFK